MTVRYRQGDWNGLWRDLGGVFVRLWIMDVVSCLPGALVGGSLIFFNFYQC
jgi:hypothetical protein